MQRKHRWSATAVNRTEADEPRAKERREGAARGRERKTGASEAEAAQDASRAWTMINHKHLDACISHRAAGEPPKTQFLEMTPGWSVWNFAARPMQQEQALLLLALEREFRFAGGRQGNVPRLHLARSTCHIAPSRKAWSGFGAAEADKPRHHRNSERPCFACSELTTGVLAELGLLMESRGT